MCYEMGKGVDIIYFYLTGMQMNCLPGPKNKLRREPERREKERGEETSGSKPLIVNPGKDQSSGKAIRTIREK